MKKSIVSLALVVAMILTSLGGFVYAAPETADDAAIEQSLLAVEETYQIREDSIEPLEIESFGAGNPKLIVNGNFEDEDVSIYEPYTMPQTEISRDTDVARTGSGSLKVSRVSGTVQKWGAYYNGNVIEGVDDWASRTFQISAWGKSDSYEGRMTMRMVVYFYSDESAPVLAYEEYVAATLEAGTGLEWNNGTVEFSPSEILTEAQIAQVTSMKVAVYYQLVDRYTTVPTFWLDDISVVTKVENLFPNGDFESEDVSVWTEMMGTTMTGARDTEEFNSGTASFRTDVVTGRSFDIGPSKMLNPPDGWADTAETYAVTGWFKRSGGGRLMLKGNVYYYDANGTILTYDTITIVTLAADEGNDWMQVSFDFTPSAKLTEAQMEQWSQTAVTLYVQIATATLPISFWMDGMVCLPKEEGERIEAAAMKLILSDDNVLQGSYSFLNYTNDETLTEGDSSYRYVRYDSATATTGTVVAEGTCNAGEVPSYPLTDEDAGHYFGFEVTPVSADGAFTGDTVKSVKVAGPFAPVASGLTVTGLCIAGRQVEGTYTYADVNNDAENGTTFRWLSSETENGTFQPIEGAVGQTLQIPDSLANQYIKFEVTPKNDGYLGDQGAAVQSAAYKVNMNSAPTADGLTVSGLPYTTSILEVSYTYTDAENDAEGETKIQWYSSDSEEGPFTAISGATGSQLGLGDDLGEKYVLAEITPADVYGAVGEPVRTAPILINKLNSGEEEVVSAFYVATDGNDDNPGTLAEPFATIEAARDAIRVMKLAGKYPATGVTVYIKGGTYTLTDSIEFKNEDSGEELAPVVYRNYNDEKVTITGGYTFAYNKFQPVSGEMQNYLIDDTAKTKVMVANVADFGLEPSDIMAFWAPNLLVDPTMGRIDDGGTTRKEIIYGLAVELDGQYMSPAKYPNSRLRYDWPLLTGDISTDTVTTTDATAKARIAQWNFSATQGDFFARAYYNADWTCVYSTCVSIDTATSTIKTIDEVDNYNQTSTSAKPGGQFINVYEEMDEPGEFYFDKKTGNFYIYPFDDATEDSTLNISNLEVPLITMDKTEYVTFYGLEFTGGTDIYGLTLENCKGTVIDNCKIHNFSDRQLLISGVDSRNNTVKNSEFYNAAGGAIRMRGGNAETLEESNDLVTNCEIHDFARLRDAYSPAVDFSYGGANWDMYNEEAPFIDGCGSTVSYCNIYNAPHEAIQLRGPKITIDHNVIHDVCENAGDMGAIYGGRRVHDVGQVISNNYFYNIQLKKAVARYNAHCYFADDGTIGGTFINNTCGDGINTTTAVKVHGGPEFNWYHNIFIDPGTLLQNQEWGATRWYGQCGSPGYTTSPELSSSMSFVIKNREVYEAEFPFLKNYIDSYVNGEYTYWKTNSFRDNISIGITTGGAAPFATSADNKQYLVDYDNGNFTVNDAGYALIRNTISDFPVFDYQAIKRPSGLVQTVTNKLPIISSVAVTRGTGNVLNGNYFYADVERDHEGISEIRWYAAETDTDSAYKEISGATAKTFTYDDTYAGQYIKMEVTPVDIFGNKGTAVRSSAVLIAKDIDAFVQQIADAQSKLDAATEGSDLGQYPSEAIDALKQAIADATEASKGEEIETPEGLTKAVEALNQAVNAFNSARVKALTDSVGSGEISIPADLEDITITLPNVTGTYTLKGSVLPKGAVITATINGKQITIEVPEAVTLPSGEFNISALENSSAADAGDVVLACSLGNTEDAYSPALNVTVDGVSGYRISYVQDGQLVEISDLTTEEQSQKFSLAQGNEVIAYGSIIYSSDATLKSLAVNGTNIPLIDGQLEYTFKLDEGVKSAVITAVPNNDNATVTIPVVEKVPAKNLEIPVKAQDGTELTYILNIGVTIPTTSPSTSPTTPVVSTPGNNTGTTISTGIHSNINNPNTGIDTPAVKNRFIDIIGHWAENDINEMADKAIVVGVTDTTFEPDRSITRAEFAALITRALKLSAANDDAVFADVASDAWYADEVAAAAGAGLISGYAGSFRPEDNITREEMAVVIMKAYVFLGKEPLKGKLDQFTDENQVSDWARQYADQAVSVGLISGMTSNTFAPQENATRAQVASIIKRLLDQ